MTDYNDEKVLTTFNKIITINFKNFSRVCAK